MSSPPRIPGYEVQERLGSGGMGEVYKAISLADRRPVALKFEGEIVTQDQGSGLRERFLREARILQGLKHENLPEFYAAGELPDGRLFIAMELLVGRPLGKFAGARLEELVPLLIQAASALQVVSEAGVVHRDVSPDNFFVVEVGGQSVVKLIDFGVSKDLEAARDGLTRVGSFVGKPAYCSPEQTGLLPEGPAADWRTDLYSFGVTIYTLLRGKLPFPPGNLLELLRARLQELPAETFQQIERERLRRLVARLLRLQPEDRPESFEEVVSELLHLQAEIAADAARRMEDSWKLRRKTTGRARRGPESTGAGPPPGTAAASPSPAASPGETSLAGVLLAPRALLAVSLTLISGALLLLFLGVARPRSLGVSGLIAAGLALATLAALRERSPRRGKSGDNAPAVGPGPASGDSAPIRDDVGDPAGGDPLPLLLRVTGDGPEREVRVIQKNGLPPPEEVLIGRSVGPDGIYLASKTVSGIQARLVRSEEGYRVENISGTNPTRINGRPLQESERHLLKDGDRIEIAQVTIVFRTPLP